MRSVFDVSLAACVTPQAFNERPTLFPEDETQLHGWHLNRR